MKSLGQKVKQCVGLIGTTDVSAWESEFLSSVNERSSNGDDTGRLSGKQVEIVEKIFVRHFA